MRLSTKGSDSRSQSPDDKKLRIDFKRLMIDKQGQVKDLEKFKKSVKKHHACGEGEALEKTVDHCIATINRVNVLFQQYAKLFADQGGVIYEGSSPHKAYNEICGSIVRDKQFSPEDCLYYGELPLLWQECSLKASLLVAEEGDRLAPYVDHEKSELLVTPQLIDDIVRDYRGSRAVELVNHITEQYKKFIQHQDCPPIFITDARHLVFVNLFRQISSIGKMTVAGFKLHQDNRCLTNFGYCFPQLPAAEACSRAKPWQEFTDSLIDYFRNVDKCKHIDNIAVLHWGGLTLAKPFELIGYKSSRSQTNERIEPFVDKLQASYQAYLEVAQPTPEQVNAQCLLLAAVVMAASKGKPVDRQLIVNYLHPLPEVSTNILEVVRDSSNFSDQASFWHQILNPVFALCEKEHIRIDASFKAHLVPAYDLEDRRALVCPMGSSLDFQPDVYAVMMMLASQVPRSLSPTGVGLDCPTAEAFIHFRLRNPALFDPSNLSNSVRVMPPKKPSLRKRQLTLLPQAELTEAFSSLPLTRAEFSPSLPLPLAESGDRVLVKAIEQPPICSLSKEIIEMKCTMLGSIADLDTQADGLRDKHREPADILSELSVTLKAKVDKLYKENRTDQEFIEKFDNFKESCQTACQAAMQKSGGVLADHRGPRQAVFNVLQTLTVLGAIVGVFRKMCGQSYSFSIFKQHTTSENIVSDVSRSLVAASAA